jgi:PKD repeat protein
MSAWIDWNNNLEFEASEQVGLDTLLANAGSNAVWNVSVPGNQATGFVHIRIRCVRNALNDTTAFTACSSHAFGETEDYRIYVQPTIPTYCTNLHSNTGFSGVSINKVNLSYTELNKTQSGCEALSGNAYTSWPITTTTCGALVQSQTYYLSVDVSPNSRVGMWFDANQNGQFESSEFNSPFTVNGNTFIYLISIPTNIPTGYSRIRIRVRDGGSLMAAGEACTLFTSGETEDFPIFIANARGAAPVAGFTVVQSGAEASYSSLATNFSDTFDWNFLGADNTANPGTDPTAYYFSTAPGCWATALTVSNFYGSDTYVNPCAVYIPETTTCDQLMISEYLCGSSQNKAIELVNASNNALNLSDWSIALFTDGSNVPSQTLNLNGSLLPYQTYVLANPAADPAIQANANILSGICSFTGNDVIALVHQGTIVDMVGVIGENPIPGWAIGASATHAIDMRRDITVSAPNADWNNALSGWIAYPSNTFDNLGTHDFNCGTFQSQTPQAAFGISQNIICAGDCINLIDQSSGTPSSWIWTLPGSLNGTANGANPGQICYDTPGTYAISLTVTGTSGFDTETLNAAVTVLPYPTPSIALNGSTLTCNGCVGDVVWYWNGEPVPDANGSQLEAFAPGTYSLSSTNAGGCTGTSISVKVFTVGIQSNATPIAHVYPNPAQDWIYIQRTNEAVNLKYALRDALGRIVQQGTLQGSMNKLEFTKQLASGIYMLSLWHDEAPQHFRIIKN